MASRDCAEKTTCTDLPSGAVWLEGLTRRMLDGISLHSKDPDEESAVAGVLAVMLLQRNNQNKGDMSVRDYYYQCYSALRWPTTKLEFF